MKIPLFFHCVTSLCVLTVHGLVLFLCVSVSRFREKFGAHSLLPQTLGLHPVEERGVVSCCLCLGALKPHYTTVVSCCLCLGALKPHYTKVVSCCLCQGTLKPHYTTVVSCCRCQGTLKPHYTTVVSCCRCQGTLKPRYTTVVVTAVFSTLRVRVGDDGLRL